MGTVVKIATVCGGGMLEIVYVGTYVATIARGPKGPADGSTTAMGGMLTVPGGASEGPRAVDFPPVGTK